MNKYLVKGAQKDSGEDIEIWIESDSSESATRVANQIGIYVSLVLVCEQSETVHIEDKEKRVRSDKQNGFKFEFSISDSKVKISNPLLALSILCFIISFFLPVAGGGVLNFTGWDAFNFSFDSMFKGIEEAFPFQVSNEVPFLNKLWINNAWLVNLFYVIIVVLIFKPLSFVKPVHLFIIAVASALIALYGAIMTFSSGDGGGFGIGYWVWLGSFVMLSGTTYKRMN